jgi:hypothetical protein
VGGMNMQDVNPLLEKGSQEIVKDIQQQLIIL